MTQQALYTFEPPNVTLSGLTVTAVADQSVNGYNLANAGAPQYEEFSWNGYPAVTFDGVDDTLKNTTGLANTMIGGNDKANVVIIVCQMTTLHAAAGNFWSCGDNASANPFYRGICNSTGATNAWDYRKRDAATGTGGGAGGAGGRLDLNPHVFTFTTTGTVCTIKVDNIQVVSAGMDVGDMGTMDNFALGCLSRTTDSAFQAMRCWAVSIHDSLTASEELDIFTLYWDRYIGRPANTCGDHFRRRI